jgi:hypothetical protein
MAAELQQLIEAQQRAVQEAQFKMYFLAYTTYADILVCAVFAVLIFWKLCQIQKQLSTRSPVGQSNNLVQPTTPRTEAGPVSASRAVLDDSRYMPKK